MYNFRYTLYTHFTHTHFRSRNSSLFYKTCARGRWCTRATFKTMALWPGRNGSLAVELTQASLSFFKDNEPEEPSVTPDMYYGWAEQRAGTPSAPALASPLSPGTPPWLPTLWSADSRGRLWSADDVVSAASTPENPYVTPGTVYLVPEPLHCAWDNRRKGSRTEAPHLVATIPADHALQHIERAAALPWAESDRIVTDHYEKPACFKSPVQASEDFEVRASFSSTLGIQAAPSHGASTCTLDYDAKTSESAATLPSSTQESPKGSWLHGFSKPTPMKHRSQPSALWVFRSTGSMKILS